MELKNLTLHNYRNYRDCCFTFDPGVNLIVGDNAQGKTNLLEAIGYLGTGKSFRTSKNQELMDKIPRLPSDIRWHMIGHLQRNKVKYLVGKVEMIHSVDSLRLAEEISREAVKQGCEVRILIEVNAAGEESKFGVRPEETEALVRAAAALPGIRVCGLMTIAPLTENAEDNRIFFRTLKNLSVDIERKNIDNVHMVCLSMGMTGDYEVAIEEGATMVRVGTGIFGERNYNI